MPDLLPCVPDNEAVLSFGYIIVGDESSTLSFGYEIVESTEEYSTLSFGYEITIAGLTSWEPTFTPVGYMTQYMGNFYPYWHAANVKNGGRTQRVMNSLAGFQITQLLTKIRRLRANLFLSTTDLSEPHKVWVAPRPVASIEQDKTINLLSNPSLSRVQPQRLGPWSWSSGFVGSTGDWELKRGLGLYGYHAVRLTAQNGESISLKQSNDLIFREGNIYTATVWYAGMRPERGTPISSRSSGPQLQINTQYSDGSTEIDSVFLEDDTNGAWKRASLSFSPSKDTHNIEVSIVVKDYEGETVVLEVGAVQLEAGRDSSVFTDNVFSSNTLYAIYPRETISEDTGWGTFSYERQKRIRIDDFLSYENLLEQLPDRCTVTTATSEVAVSNNVLDAIIESTGQQFSIGWRIANNLIERYNVDIRQNEIWGYYKIADLYGNGDTDLLFFRPADLGVTSTYEALTVAGEWLYVMVKETYLGKTTRVLKICSPYIRWDDTNHLESFADIYVDDGTGTCTFLGVINGRSDQLLMTVSSVDKVIDLIWDSAARNTDGTLIFRSDLGEATVVG
jgi:hypothetical protein